MYFLFYDVPDHEHFIMRHLNSTMSEDIFSQECQEGRHAQCSIQIPKRGGPETVSCQCPCHPQSIPGTFVAVSRSVEDKKLI